jgi:hypothetical protein
MNEAFFSKEVLGEGVIGGGLVNVGAVAVNNYVSGLANITGNAEAALVTVLSLAEGYAAAYGENKVKTPWVKEVLKGAKYIIPGNIPLLLANRAGVVKFGTPIDVWAFTKGLNSRTYIITKYRGATPSAGQKIIVTK